MRPVTLTEKSIRDTDILSSSRYTAAENNSNRDTYGLNSSAYMQQEKEEKPKESVWKGKRIVAIKLKSKF